MMKKLCALSVILLLICHQSFSQDKNYTQTERIRLELAQSVEKEIARFISSNLDRCKLDTSVIDAIRNNLDQDADHSGYKATENDFQNALKAEKKRQLRELFFQQNPEKRKAFVATDVSKSLIECANGGFEDEYDSYNFEQRVVISGSLTGACDAMIDDTPFTPTATDDFSALASIVTSGNEPVLDALGVSINRVFSGSQSLKLNSTPSSVSAEISSGEAVRVFKNVTIDDETIEFRFLQLGHVVSGNAHPQPYFRFRILDPVTGEVLKNDCFPIGVNDCRYSYVPDTRAGWSAYSYLLCYTNQWICERVYVKDLLNRNVTLEFTVSDCQARQHFSTAYIDDICGVSCDPTWGSIDLTPVEINCPTSPFQICGNLDLPSNVELAGDIELHVVDETDTLVASIEEYTLDGSNFCFMVNPMIFGVNPTGHYSFEIQAPVAQTGSCSTSYVLNGQLSGVAFEGCCSATLITSAPYTNVEIYERRSEWIQATNIFSGTSAMGIYHAGDFVELNPGFETAGQAKFSAYILGCENIFDYRPDSIIEHPNEEFISSQPKSGNLLIYPNPSDRELNLVLEDGIITGLSVFTMDGKQILRTTSESGNLTIDVSLFSKGLYLISVQDGLGNMHTSKFVKK